MSIKGRVESLAFISNFRVFKQKDLFVVVVVIFSSVSKRTSELMFQRTVEVSLFAVRVSTRDAKNLVYPGFRSVWGFHKHTRKHKLTDTRLDLILSNHCAL